MSSASDRPLFQECMVQITEVRSSCVLPAPLLHTQLEFWEEDGILLPLLLPLLFLFQGRWVKQEVQTGGGSEGKRKKKKYWKKLMSQNINWSDTRDREKEREQRTASLQPPLLEWRAQSSICFWNRHLGLGSPAQCSGHIEKMAFVDHSLPPDLFVSVAKCSRLLLMSLTPQINQVWAEGEALAEYTLPR